MEDGFYGLWFFLIGNQKIGFGKIDFEFLVSVNPATQHDNKGFWVSFFEPPNFLAGFPLGFLSDNASVNQDKIGEFRGFREF